MRELKVQIGNSGYSVFARLDDGEFLFVPVREELEQAIQLAHELLANWLQFSQSAENERFGARERLQTCHG
jgi:hypothetical protein